MNSIFENSGIIIAEWILTYFLHSTVLFLAVLFLVKSNLVKGLSLQNALWKVALVGGILTASLQVTYSWKSVNISDYTPITWDIEAVEETPVLAFDAAPEPEDILASDVIEETALLEHLYTIDESYEPIAASTPPFYATYTWKEWLAYGWLLAICILLLRQVVVHIYFFKKIGTREQITNADVLGIVKKLVGNTNLGKIPYITFSQHLSTPIVIKNKEICLPSRALSQLSAEQQQNLLAHEIAHIVRKDYYWLVIGKTIETLFFFQPFNKIINKNLQATTEQLCDQWAAKMTGNHIALAQCLVEVATWVSNKSPYPLVAGMALKKSELSNRIHQLLNQEKMINNKWKLVEVISASTLLILVAIFAMPRVSIAMHSLTELTAFMPINEINTYPQITPDETDIADETDFADEETDVADEETTYNEKSEGVKRRPSIDIPLLQQLTIHAIDTNDPKKAQPIKSIENVKVADIERAMRELERRIEQKAEKLEKLHDNLEIDHEELEQIHEKMAKEMELAHDKLEQALEAQHEKMEEVQDKIEEEMRLLEERMHDELDNEDNEELRQRKMKELQEAHSARVKAHQEKMKMVQKELELKMQVHHKQMEAVQQAVAEKQRVVHEKIATQQEAMHQKMEAIHKELEVEHKKMEALHEKMEAKHKAFEQDLVKNLIQDKVINSEDDLKSIDVQEDKIKINGKALNKSLEAKYRNLMEKHFGDIDGRLQMNH